MATAMQKVVALPELLSKILEHIYELDTLAKCARINRAWHELSIKILWRGHAITSQYSSYLTGPVSPTGPTPWKSPPLSALMTLAADSKRFQHYTQHIQHLFLSRTIGYPGNLRYTHVPEPFKSNSLWSSCRPRSLFLGCCTSDLLESGWICLLQPRLETLELFGGSYDGRLASIFADTPKLRWLSVDTVHLSLEQGVPEILPELPSLQGLMIGKHSNHHEWHHIYSILKDVIPWSTLKHLSLASDRSAELFRDLFSRLRELESVEIAFERLPQLQRVLPHLRMLSAVHVRETQDEDARFCDQALSALRGYPQLTEITMTARYVPSLGHDTLTGLVDDCPYLRRLEITNYESPLPDEGAFVTTSIQVVTERLPLLESLVLANECIIKPLDLAVLATNCPNLKFLHLNANVDLLALSRCPKKVIFKNLSHLSLGTLYMESFTNTYDPGAIKDEQLLHIAEEMLALVKLRMPMLINLGTRALDMGPMVCDEVGRRKLAKLWMSFLIDHNFKTQGHFPARSRIALEPFTDRMRRKSVQKHVQSHAQTVAGPPEGFHTPAWLSDITEPRLTIIRRLRSWELDFEADETFG